MPDSQLKYIYGTRKTVEVALSEVNFEEYKKYVPTFPKNEWVKKAKVLFAELSEEKKESLFIISGFITMFYKFFRCFWTPWTMGDTTRKKTFNHEFIDKSYVEILNIVEKNPDIEDSFAIKAHYEHLYGYFLVEDFLKGIDEIYWFLSSNHPIMITRDTLNDNGLLILFRGLSVRGSHRTKIWPTYMTPHNTYSRRPTIGQYSQLTPEAEAHFNGISTTEKKVNWLMRGTREIVDGSRKPAQWIDAIHPHISNREPCLGGWQSRLSKDAEYGYAKVFMKDLKGYLCTWSSSSPFWNINHQYRHTYNFPAIKGRTRCHWDALDTQYIRINFPDILRKDYRWNVARLAMQQKHETGYYTDKFLSKYEVYLQVKMVNARRTCEILNRIHGLHLSEMSRQYWSSMNDIGYIRIYFLEKYAWTLNDSRGGTVTLSQSLYGIRPRNIFTDMIMRAKMCIREFINMDNENAHWTNIDPLKITDIKLAEKLGALNKIEEVYNGLYDTYNEKEFNEYELLHENPWNSDVYYNTYLLKLVMDYEFMRKFLDNWVKITYEREISKLTNLTKEFSNELTNHSNLTGQSELFPQNIPS